MSDKAHGAATTAGSDCGRAPEAQGVAAGQAGGAQQGAQPGAGRQQPAGMAGGYGGLPGDGQQQAGPGMQGGPGMGPGGIPGFAATGGCVAAPAEMGQGQPQAYGPGQAPSCGQGQAPAYGQPGQGGVPGYGMPHPAYPGAPVGYPHQGYYYQQPAFGAVPGGYYPGQHAPGMGGGIAGGMPPGFAPGMGAAAGAGMGAGMGAGVGAGMGQGRQFGMAEMIDEIANGGSGLSSIGKFLNFDDSEFWKGALIGAAAVLLLTNESVQDTLFKTGVKAKNAVKTGAEKMKDTATDAAAKIKSQGGSMSDYYVVPYAPPVAAAPSDDTCRTLIQLATIGAVVGGSAAAGTSIRRLQREEQTAQEALADVGRAAAVSGVATAVAGAVATAVAGHGLTRLAVLFAAGTAVMYGLQRSAEEE